jgi:hypothetical protein
VARVGRFGRLPRSSPDLSATIVSMLREYANQVDSNMLDAWKNGGKVDGKPVTDGRLLAHLKSRRDVLDKADPMWAQWNNRVLQYGFSIEESKMRVKWDNKTASAGDMAAFYHRWEQKTPNNTEFDRSLRSSYGQWAHASAARTGADKSKAAAAKHQKWATGIYDSQIKSGDSLNTALVWLAQEVGIIPPGNSASLADTELSQADFTQLLDIVQDGKALNSAFQPSVDRVTAYMKGIDPKFSWGESYLATTMSKADAGAARLIKGATTKTEANAWAKTRANIAITSNRAQALPTIHDYDALRTQLESDLEASANDPAAQRVAYKTYLDGLKGIGARLTAGGSIAGNSHTDQALSGPVMQEAAAIESAMNGGPLLKTMPPTLYDSSSGTTAQSGQDAQDMTNVLNGMNANQKILTEGGWATPTLNKDTGKLEYTYFSKDVAPRFDMVMVPAATNLGGIAVPMWVAPTAVPSVTVDQYGNPTKAAPVLTNAKGEFLDATGAVIPPGSKDAAKKIVEDQQSLFSIVTFPGRDGREVKLYRSIDNGGQPVWTIEPPLMPSSDKFQGATIKSDANGNPMVVIPANRDQFNQTGQTFDNRQYSSIALLAPGEDGKVDISRIPSAFHSLAGATFAREFTNLDPDASGYAATKEALLKDLADAPAQMTAYAAQLTRDGKNNEAQAMLAQIPQLQQESTNIRLAIAVADTKGDPGKLINVFGLQPAIDAAGKISTYLASETTGDLQDKHARQWLLAQVNAQQAAFNNPDNMIGDTHGTVGNAFAAAKAQINDPLVDPRSLKLPGLHITATNPFGYEDHGEALQGNLNPRIVPPVTPSMFPPPHILPGSAPLNTAPPPLPPPIHILPGSAPLNTAPPLPKTPPPLPPPAYILPGSRPANTQS